LIFLLFYAAVNRLYQPGAASRLAESNVSNSGWQSSGRLHYIKLGLLVFWQNPMYQTGSTSLRVNSSVSNWGC